MLKRLSALVLLVLSTACAVKSTGPHIDPPPPPAPATFTLFAHVCDGVPCEPGNEVHKRPATDVTIDTPERTWNDGVSDPSGNRIVEGLPAGTYHVCARAQGFVLACADVTFPRPEGSDVFLVLVPDVIPVDRVHVDGKVFRDTSGAIWQYRGGTSFLLLKRYIQGVATSFRIWIIAATQVRTRCASSRRSRGVRSHRRTTPTSSSARSCGGAFPRDARRKWWRSRMRADWSLERQQQHVQRIVNLVAAAGALDLVEVANEPFKNSAPPVDVMRKVTRPSIRRVLAAGDYSDNAVHHLTPFLLDYLTYHPERKDEWPRTAKDARELRDGFDCGVDGKPGFGGVHVPGRL
jgi:hypothetical protein